MGETSRNTALYSLAMAFSKINSQKKQGALVLWEFIECSVFFCLLLSAALATEILLGGGEKVRGKIEDTPVLLHLINITLGSLRKMYIRRSTKFYSVSILNCKYLTSTKNLVMSQIMPISDRLNAKQKPRNSEMLMEYT